MARRRFVMSSGNNTQADDSQVRTSHESIDDTSCGIQAVFKTALVCALLFYVLTPTILYFFPKLLEQIVFMNLFCSSDEVASLSKPSIYDLHGTATFYLDCEDSKLGLWHVLPKDKASLYEDDVIVSEETVQSALKNADNIIIYHHGNGMSRATGDGNHRTKFYSLLQSQGYHVITFDYRGFGDSTGWPSENGLVQDSQCILKWIRNVVPSTAKVSFWGHSLGSSISTLSAALTFEECTRSADNCHKIDNLIIEGAFTNIKDGASDSLPARLFKMIYPGSLFQTICDASLNVYDIKLKTDENISKVGCPVLILHAEDDDLIPCKHGEKLFQMHKNSKNSHYVKLVKFKAEHGYKHFELYKEPKLPQILKEFLQHKDEPETDSITV